MNFIVNLYKVFTYIEIEIHKQKTQIGAEHEGFAHYFTSLSEGQGFCFDHRSGNRWRLSEK